MSSRTRLELTWPGKEHQPKPEPRILLEDADKSYHAAHRMGETDQFDNLLVQGDNLLALKALEAEYTGKIKCVFIDPPYNTGSAFSHYDDGMEHSLWLSMMRDRLVLLRNLLSEDGSLWITIDDNEAHYLKVICDEIFGRGNFVASVIWEKRYSPQNAVKWFSESHDSILVYARNKANWSPNLLERSEEMNARYRNLDNDPRGIWKPADATAQGGHGTKSQFYVLTAPNGKQHKLPNGRCWVYTEPVMNQLIADNRIWFGANGNNVPAVKRFLSEVKQGIAAQTIWKYTEVGHNQEAKREILSLFGASNVFDTPKPERLINRILHLATNPGDLILDSFAGSGTTGAVAHKMRRRWIMVELGEHATTHVAPRLKKVIDGTDVGGISKTVGWKGGGGFRFYHLAPSLMEQDSWGNWIINKSYNAAMLAEALCKLECFTYAPASAVWWQHGYSTEQDFIYITTATLTHEQLQQLSDEVGTDRTLLVLCPAFRSSGAFPNLTVKKIPKHVLSRCEWGKDDYSLQVAALPDAPPEPGQQMLFTEKRETV